MLGEMSRYLTKNACLLQKDKAWAHTSDPLRQNLYKSQEVILGSNVSEVPLLTALYPSINNARILWISEVVFPSNDVNVKVINEGK